MACIAVACMLTAAAHGAPPSAAQSFEVRLQAIADEYSAVTGLPLQIGFVDADSDIAVAADKFGAEEGRVALTTDTPFLYGSGVKTFIGTRVMQLVDAGVLSLDDKAAKYMDPVLRAMNDTSFASLFGANASAVTVGQLVRMSAGIADYDVPSVDNAIIDAANVTSPIDILLAFADRTQFVCEPGSCVSYSSTNYLLAGFVLLGAADLPAAELAALGAEAWTALAQRPVLDYATVRDPERFRATRFLDHGAMSSLGLKIPGYDNVRNGTRQQVWMQDASILGWTCGNLMTTAQEYARFIWDLLGDPTHPVLSAQSLAAMTDVRPLDVGWARGVLQYGTGLMVQSVYSGDSHYPFYMNGTGAFLGHGGETYGFGSNSGFFPLVNASISAAVAQTDIPADVGSTPSAMMCHVLEAAANILHGMNISLSCRNPQQYVSCVSGGENATKYTGQCVPDHKGTCYDCHKCGQLPHTSATCLFPKLEKYGGTEKLDAIKRAIGEAAYY